MNREIKFRVCNKRLGTIHYTKKWNDGAFMCSIALFESEGEIYQPNVEDFVWEQYTGLKDKNGKEIYEGDIVKYWLNIDGNLYEQNETLEIVFWQAKFCTKLCGSFRALNKNMAETMIEVIGNIHENPELIKNEKQKI